MGDLDSMGFGSGEPEQIGLGSVGPDSGDQTSGGPEPRVPGLGEPGPRRPGSKRLGFAGALLGGGLAFGGCSPERVCAVKVADVMGAVSCEIVSGVDARAECSRRHAALRLSLMSACMTAGTGKLMKCGTGKSKNEVLRVEDVAPSGGFIPTHPGDIGGDADPPDPPEKK